MQFISGIGSVIIGLVLIISFSGISLGEEPYGIMHLSREERIAEHLTDQAIRETDMIEEYPGPGEVSLLPLIPYIPSERNQGSCGNCWAWTGTGIVETAHTVQTGISDRLSIQYLNSFMNGGGTLPSGYGGSSFACDGGGATKFSAFYQGNEANRTLVPWSNINASYFDGNGGQPGGLNGSYRTMIPAESITTTPRYPITSMEAQWFDLSTMTREQAIGTIKNELYNNRALYCGYSLPNSSSWRDFSRFWSTQTQDTFFSLDPYNGTHYEETGGGHAVLLVGYNDTDPDPANHYWTLLNSWGNNTLRPEGTFRFPMQMNYQNVDDEGYPNFRIYRITTEFAAFHPAPVISGIFPSSGIQNTIIPLVNITGSNFETGDRIAFTRDGDTCLTSAGVKDQSNLTITGLNLAGVPAGIYSLTVTSQTTGWTGILPRAFTVNGPEPTPEPVPKLYNIQTGSDNLGTIIPSGEVLIVNGTNQTFIMQAKPGAVISELTVDGIEISSARGKTSYTYTFPAISANHTIFLTGRVLDGVLIASFSQNQSSGTAPLTVQFTDTSAGNPDRWFWTFGDGHSSSRMDPIHTYSIPGSYTVSLYARNHQASSSISRENLIQVR